MLASPILLLFSARFLLLLIVTEGSSAAECQTCPTDDRVLTKEQFIDNDFETNGVFPWVEESPGGVQWKIENKTSPWETKNEAPQPIDGRNYLRVHRGQSFSSFGVAVLRSPRFGFGLSDQIDFSFSFWIRSKWPQFTNLELFMAKDGNERLLISLHDYSNITNGIWQSITVSLNGKLSSNISLVFYAYCGTETEDAVAIDNLRLSLKQSCQPAWMLIKDSVTSASSTEQPLTDMTVTTADPTTEAPTDPMTSDSDTTTDPPSSTSITTWPWMTTAPTTTPTNTPSTKQTTTLTTPSLGRCECPTLCPSCYLPIHPNACVSKYNTCYGGFLYPQECPNSNVFDPLLSSCTSPAMASCNKNETS